MTPSETNRYREYTAKGGGPSSSGFPLLVICSRCKQPASASLCTSKRVYKGGFWITKRVCAKCQGVANEQK